MSYLPSYILLADLIRTNNFYGIGSYKSELQSLSPAVQLELFTQVLLAADTQATRELVLIIDAYCPEIMYDLLHFAIDTRNRFLFAILYEDYGVMRLN